MVSQRHLGHLCPYAKECPVYQEELIVKDVIPFLIKNVFCNRGQKGWKNCERFKLAEAGQEIPKTATPYKQK
ncbi:hypothetical protein [uncultured Sunxiuqinia sp.]|uniref:hypothetical protein n=1 Tax=uncultured Sunxiuqinia sp. TaxID=1573825 RepID=UPI002AA962E8|nr:hypothetical protein [uncultured Sunxiuqinia sp.]